MLLLDALPTEIGVRCVRALDYEADRCDIEISAEPALNTLTAVLIRRDTMIPTRKTLVARLLNNSKTPSIQFVEIGLRQSDQMLIGEVVVAGAESTRRLSLTADIDANRTIVVDIEGAGTGIRVQLNNFFTSITTGRAPLPVMRIAEPGFETASLEGKRLFLKARG